MPYDYNRKTEDIQIFSRAINLHRKNRSIKSAFVLFCHSFFFFCFLTSVVNGCKFAAVADIHHSFARTSTSISWFFSPNRIKSRFRMARSNVRLIDCWSCVMFRKVSKYRLYRWMFSWHRLWSPYLDIGRTAREQLSSLGRKAFDGIGRKMCIRRVN